MHVPPTNTCLRWPLSSSTPGVLPSRHTSVRSQGAYGAGEADEEEKEVEEEGEVEKGGRETVVEAAGSRIAAATSREERGGGADVGGDDGNGKDVPAGKADKDQLKAERGRRILSTIDLVETLVGGFAPLLPLLLLLLPFVLLLLLSLLQSLLLSWPMSLLLLLFMLLWLLLCSMYQG